MTSRAPFASIRPVKPISLAAILAVLFSTVLPGSAQLTATPAPVDPGTMTEAEFKSLLDKTNLYVHALNAVQSAQRSFQRYSSWVDVAKGPTGRERYISYGLYDIGSSSVTTVKEAAEKGPRLAPPLPDLDGAVARMAEAFSALAPIVKKADDYYEQEDYKDDGAKGAKELHAAMMPLFQQTFAAEKELRRGLDVVKNKIDRRQLGLIEKQYGRKYEWHLRAYLIDAKALIDLLPEGGDGPAIDPAEYKARYANLETSYNAFQTFQTENPEEVRKVLMASFVETAVKDFFTSSKFLRRTLEGKSDKREYLTRLEELIRNYNTLISRTNTMR